MVTSRSYRRAFALAVCLLWLLGVEVLPNLHLGTHRDDHTHAGDGSIVQIGEHRHGDVVHSHGKPAPKKKRGSQLAFDDVAFLHAATGVGHHAVALQQPAAPLLEPLAVDQPSSLVEHAPDTVAQSVGLHRPRARGPPA